MLPLTNQPYTLTPGAGPLIRTLGLPGWAKATGQQTGGAFSLVEVLCPPGYATPLHIHYVEDEAIYILEGQLVIFSGGEGAAAAVGSFAYHPRGIPHGFRSVGAGAARILCFTIPAGYDHGSPELAASAAGMAVPSANEMDLDQLADLAASHKTEVLGPLPGPEYQREG